jgi:hypothetical protein
MPKKRTSVFLQVRLLVASRAPKEEGWVRLTGVADTIVADGAQEAFDSLDDLGDKVRKVLVREGIDWPPIDNHPRRKGLRRKTRAVK